jgi:hypothetical protein
VSAISTIAIIQFSLFPATNRISSAFLIVRLDVLARDPTVAPVFGGVAAVTEMLRIGQHLAQMLGHEFERAEASTQAEQVELKLGAPERHIHRVFFKYGL